MKDSLAHVSFPNPRNLHRIANIVLKSSPGGRDPRPQRSASQSCLNQIINILTFAIKINISTSNQIKFRESVLSDIAKIIMPDDLPHEHSYYSYHHQQHHHISNLIIFREPDDLPHEHFCYFYHQQKQHHISNLIDLPHSRRPSPPPPQP